jgi:hypothetical protein
MMNRLLGVLSGFCIVAIVGVCSALLFSAFAQARDRDDLPCVACATCPAPLEYVPCQHTKHGDKCSTHKFFKPVY